jgi:hypothetical protein
MAFGHVHETGAAYGEPIDPDTDTDPDPERDNNRQHGAAPTAAGASPGGR